jgi:hypothetical protein
MQKILQINFNYSVTVEQLTEAFKPLVQPIADVKGLTWKVWIHDGEDKSAGGVYLFEDKDSVTAYLNSDIIKNLGAHPALSNITMKVSDPIPEFSKVTRGPL